MSDRPQHEEDPSSGFEYMTTVYDVVVRILVDLGVSESDAKDRIIIHCLARGDTDAFVHYQRKGHVPGRGVLSAFSIMLTENARNPGIGLSKKVAAEFPYMLVCKRRDGRPGRRDDPAVELRDEVLAMNVKTLMAEHHHTYEAAIEAVAELVSEGKKGVDGRSLKYETVRKAYDHFARSKGKNSPV